MGIALAIMSAAQDPVDTVMPEKTSETSVPMRAITQGPKGHWFSYYDKQQFDTTGRYALGMELDIQRQKPSPDDAIRLGMIDLDDNDLNNNTNVESTQPPATSYKLSWDESRTARQEKWAAAPLNF